MIKQLGFRFVSVLPKTALTNLAGVAADLPLPKFARTPVYSAFAGAVGADLGEVGADLGSFRSFNEFFARPLREGAREIATARAVSPADGRLDSSGRVSDGRLIQAKGIDYAAEELLGGGSGLEWVRSALYATVYLSPADYHRVHTPFTGAVSEVRHIGGELWPVNGLSVPFVNGLFCRNERVAGLFELPGGQRGALVMVGATVVGRIKVADPRVRMGAGHGPVRVATPLVPAWELGAGDEFGRFEMGSTAIVLLEDRGGAALAPGLGLGSRLRVGEPLFV